MKICGICGDPYRLPISHTQRRHKTPMWDQFFRQRYMSQISCGICKKAIRGDVKAHARKKHEGKAAKEFVQAGGLS
jgi:hypothetical protein